MGSIILGIVFLLVCYLAIFVWYALPYALIIAIVAAIIVWIVRKKLLDNYRENVEKAEIISEEPIIKRVAENTGYTVSYGRWLSTHNHYRYKNVVTGKRIKFMVYWKSGLRETVVCKEHSATYNILITKVA